MSKAVLYGQQCLASAGFVVWDNRVAMKVAPHLWNGDGLNCRHDFGRLYADQVLHHLLAPTCHQISLNLEGFGPCLVLARSLDQIEQRVLWITGLRVVPAGQELPAPAKPRVERPAPAPEPNGDQFHGIVTREPGRTCSACEHMSPGSACTQSEKSGLQFPKLNVLRRCPAFVPHFDAIDGRTGERLWPELSLSQTC